jgi:hypothetical protein
MLYSPFATWSDEIYGKLTPPNNVTDFFMISQGDQANLSWTGVPDLDVINGGTYWVRYTSAVSASWAAASDITKTIPGNATSYSVPLMSGTYLIKALDSSGNESGTATKVTSNVADILSLNAVYTSVQNPNYGSNTADEGINNPANTNIFYDTNNQSIQIDTINLASGTHDAYYNTGTHEDDVVSSGTHDDARSTGTSNDILVSGTHDDNLATGTHDDARDTGTYNEYIATGTHDGFGTGTHDDARATGVHNAILNSGSTELNNNNIFDTASGNFDSRLGNFDDIAHTTNMLEDDNASFDSSWLNNIIRNTTDNTTATVNTVTSSTRLILSSDIFDGYSGDAYRLETKANQLRDTTATFVAADIGRTIRNNTDGGTATISTINSSSLVTLSSALFQNDHGDTWELEAGPNVLRDTGASFTSALVGRTVRNVSAGTTATVSSFTSTTELVLSSGIFDNKNTHVYQVEAGPSKLYNTGGGFSSGMVGNKVYNTTRSTTTTVSAYVSANELTLSSGIFDNKEGDSYNVNNELNRLRDLSASFSTADIGRTVRNTTDNTTTTIASRLSNTEVTLSSGIFNDSHGDTWELEAGPRYLRDIGAGFTSALVGRTVRNTNDNTTATVSTYVSSTELILSSGIFDNKNAHNYEVEVGPNKLYNTGGGFVSSHVGNLVRNTNTNTTATVSAYVSANELTLSSGIFDNKNGHTYNVHNETGRVRDTGASFSSSDVGRTIRNNTDNTTTTISGFISSNELTLSSGIFNDQSGDIWEIEAGPNNLRDTGASFTSALVGRTVRNTNDSTTATVSAFVNSNELTLSSGIFDNKDTHTYQIEPGYDRLYDPTASFSTEVVGKVVRNTTDNTTATISSRTSSTELVLSSPIFDNQDGEGYRIEVPNAVLRDTGASFTSTHDNRLIRNLDTGALSSISSVQDSNTLILEADIFGQTNSSNYKVEGDVLSYGYYYFTAQDYDLGEVYTNRLTASYASSSFSTTSLFDATSGLFDEPGKGLFDGSDISDTNASMEVSITSDDPSGASPTWSTWAPFFVGDYTARGIRFRSKLTSSNTTHNVRLDALSATIDMPDTIKRDTHIISSSGTNNGTEVITYSTPFKATPTVGITVQNFNSGEYYTITSATTTGFTVTFYTSSSIATQKTFNWISTGY